MKRTTPDERTGDRQRRTSQATRLVAIALIAGLIVCVLTGPAPAAACGDFCTP